VRERPAFPDQGEPFTLRGIPFATEYLRRGGSLFHLQKVLGHTTLEMVRRYANLVTADLQAVHQRVSLLSFR
jgi:site-specific recombinase XerD